jgi:hypothetical protein
MLAAPADGFVADGIAGAVLPEWHTALRADRFALQLTEAEAQVI